jgi:uracil-DNA glycosylase
MKDAAAEPLPTPNPKRTAKAKPAPNGATAVAPPPAAEHEPFVPRYAEQLPADWRAVLAEEFAKPYYRKLDRFVAAERQAHTVYPAEDDVFRAFALTPFGQVRVVLLGDSPFVEAYRAHGLAYSVRPGTALTPVLENLFRELRHDLGCWLTQTGCLTPWAKQGVLLLNSVLTANAGDPGAHRDRGWEKFTDAVVRALDARDEPVAFLLCGPAGRRKQPLIDADRHPVVIVPSPWDPEFRGSRPFSAVNNALEVRGRARVYWQLFGA